MQHVVSADMKMDPISAENKLPNTCNKAEATRKGAKKIRDDDIEDIIHETARRTALEFEEYTDIEPEDIPSDSESSDDDESESSDDDTEED